MVQSRIDWKYLLGLELTDTGFNYSVLAEFRARLLRGEAEVLLLDALLEQLRERKLIKAGGKQRSDSSQVIAAVRLLNRLEMLGETLRAALNALAVAAPEWLVEQIPVEWFDLYGRRIEDYRLPDKDKDRERETWAVEAGIAGFSLYQGLGQHRELEWLLELPAVSTMRQHPKGTRLQQFWQEDGQVRLRPPDSSPPPAQRIHSPYDQQARYASKREMSWLGYKVHLTETCEEHSPNLITQVHTTVATVPDVKATAPIEENLARRNWLPQKHIVDGGYIGAEQVLESQTKHQLELVGPLRLDASWQGQAGAGYDIGSNKLDWQAQQATCPQGVVSQKWETKTTKAGEEYVYVAFSKAVCNSCPAKLDCTRQVSTGRVIRLRPQTAHQAITKQREWQNSPQYLTLFNLRAGIEGTLSQAVRVFELRRTRYRGLAKTHLQHILIAVALNLVRLWNWWEGVPRVSSRLSRLKALKPAA